MGTRRSLFRRLEEEDDAFEDPFRGARIRIPASQATLPTSSQSPTSSAASSTPRPPAFSDLTAHVAAEFLFATGIRVSEFAGLLDDAVDL